MFFLEKGKPKSTYTLKLSIQNRVTHAAVRKSNKTIILLLHQNIRVKSIRHSPIRTLL